MLNNKWSLFHGAGTLDAPAHSYDKVKPWGSVSESDFLTQVGKQIVVLHGQCQRLSDYMPNPDLIESLKVFDKLVNRIGSAVDGLGQDAVTNQSTRPVVREWGLNNASSSSSVITDDDSKAQSVVMGPTS